MPNPTLAQMGFLDEDTQQEVVYDIEDSEARSNISALENKIGSANGIAELDSNGKVPSAQLPSYVDDVLEYASESAFPVTGETGKIYIALDTNKTFRWSGSAYVEISESLALGETSSTAYAGNKGKANADAIAAIKDGSSIDSFGDVETALANKVDKVTGKGLSTNDYTNTAKGIVDNIQDNVIANTKLIKDTVGWSGKNKLTPRWNVSSGTAGQDVTIEYDSNRVVSLSGTALAKVSFDIKRRMPNNNDSDFYLPIGKYKYSISEASINGIGLLVATTYNNAYTVIPSTIDTDGGLVFEITQNTQSDYKLADGSVLVGVYIEVNKDINTDGIKLYPMVTDADIIDRRYEPYFGSTAFPRSEQAVLGAKNLLPNYSGSITKKGITFTLNSDGSVTANGTATDNCDYVLVGFVNDAKFLQKFRNKKVTLSGGLSNSKRIQAWATNPNVFLNSQGSDSSNVITDNIINSSNFNFAIYILSDTVCDNDVFYPMLRLASDTDDTYTPYAMTNKELTEKVIFNKSLGGTISDTYCDTETSIISIVKQGNVVQLTGSIVVTTEIPSYTVFISDLPKLAVPSNGGNSRAYNFTIFGTGTSYRAYLDASGKIAPHSVPIPTGSYVIGITYIAES